MSKNLLKIFKKILPFEDFLYILQLEEYYTFRYLRAATRLIFRRELQKHGELKYTQRIKATLFVSIVLFISFNLLVINWIFISLPITCLLIPYFIALANSLLNPLYNSLKNAKHIEAKKSFIEKVGNARVIAIAGSYGKTTVRNILYQMTGHNFITQTLPGNINTPTGIAYWILNEFRSNTELVIAEMDTYQKGEIERSCMIIPPDIAVITNIDKQHLERFGNSKNLANAILELFICSKPDAKLFCSREVRDLIGKLKVNLGKREVIVFAPLKNVSGAKLSDSMRENVAVAATVAKEIGVSSEFIRDEIGRLDQPERRQKKDKLAGFDILDDSYNISLPTATAGIAQAKKIAGSKKLLVITGGIPELGKENSDWNVKLGELVGANAEYVVILNTTKSGDIRRGLAKSNFSENRIFLADSMKQAWEKITGTFKPTEVFVLMQPELTDLYY